MMFDRRVKKLIKESRIQNDRTVTNTEFKPDWNGLLIRHLHDVRLKKQKKRRRVKAVATVSAILAMTFVSLILLTSMDELKAGNFNILDAIRDLGQGIETNELRDRADFVRENEKVARKYGTYGEFLAENPISDYFKAEYTAHGYILSSMDYTEEYGGNTLTAKYYNAECLDMYTITGYFRNPDVEQSSDIVYPNSEHSVIEIEGVYVDLYTSSYMNVAEFFINDIHFTVVFNYMPEAFPYLLISSIETYEK